MMDWTDRHCRYFHRTLSRNVKLYTEMVTSAALVRGQARHLLRFDPSEHPVALQLGGSEPHELAEAAAMAEGEGYDEINLNVGCPSDRVQSGTFGAVLMKSPDLVAECVAEMRAAVRVPVTVKCRIGVDDQDPAEVLPDFIGRMRAEGVREIAIHARKAWLKGLSPRENREIPPLDHDLVLAMKSAFPDMSIVLNGGIESITQVEDFLAKGVDGVMVGRAAYQRPWDILGDADRRLFGAENPCSDPHEAVERMCPYIEAHLSEGGRLHAVTRHMLGLFHGRPGARKWRRMLSESTAREDDDLGAVLAALAEVEQRRAA